MIHAGETNVVVEWIPLARINIFLQKEWSRPGVSSVTVMIRVVPRQVSKL